MSTTRPTAALAVAAALLPVGIAGANHATAPGTATVSATSPLGVVPAQGGSDGAPGSASDGTTGQGWGGYSDGSGSTGGSTGQGWGGPWGGRGWGSQSTTARTSGTPVASAKGVVLVDTVLPGGEGAGTGITLTSDGTVLTNYHVVEGATKITVTDSTTGRNYTATVVGHDQTHDIAVLRLTGASGLSTAVVNGATSSVGTAVTAVGQGGGQGVLYAAQGTITATDQEITAGDEAGTSASEKLTGLIETSADVVPGYSGGPLLDAQGRVVGIDTAASSGGDITGYAVPIDQAMSIATTIQAGQRTDTVHIGPRAALGIAVSSQATAVAGAPVLDVTSGSAAASAGITAGSVITGIDGTTVAATTDLTEALATDYPGTHVTVTWTDPQGVSHRKELTLGTSQAA